VIRLQCSAAADACFWCELMSSSHILHGQPILFLKFLHVLLLFACSYVSSCGGVEITPLIMGIQCFGRHWIYSSAFLPVFFGNSWQEDTVNVGKHTTTSNGDTSQQFAQLLIIAHCQLNVARDNTSLLVVTSGIACQLNNLGRKVLQDCCLHMTETSSETTSLMKQ